MSKRYFNSALLKRAATESGHKSGYNMPLRELYPGATPLPKEPAFKKPTTRTILSQTDKEPFLSYTMKGHYTDPNNIVRITTKQPRSTYTLSRKTVPFYDAAERLYTNVSNLTNAQGINIQAGDDNYFNTLTKHLQNIPLQDRIRAGLRIAPKSEMEAFGRTKALIPNNEKVMAGLSSAAYNFLKNQISISDSFEEAPDYSKPLDLDYSNDNLYNIGTKKGSAVRNGVVYSHEFNHRGSSPAGGEGDLVTRNQADPVLRQTLPSLVSPLYYNAPLIGKMSVMPKSMTRAQYKSIGGDQPAADPAIRRDSIWHRPDDFMVDTSFGSVQYSESEMEMTQGLISLNRAQNLLQQTIRRNPQVFLDAGVDQQSMQEFLNLPTFLKSPEQLDQRMEFYLNNPVFMHLLGNEPARIIPRYFMMERERRNLKRSQESKDYWQDLFDFTRSNYFLGHNQNPSNTGMGRYMRNTTAQA